jgi:hypothetical protein
MGGMGMGSGADPHQGPGQVCHIVGSGHHMDGTLELIYWDQQLDFVPPVQAARPKAQAANPQIDALPVPSAARTTF